MMADGNETTSDRKWHLDKRVPVALIVTLIVQMAVGVAWMSALGERVNTLERSDSVRVSTAPINADRLTRVEVKIEAVQEGIAEIKRLVQRPVLP